MVTGPSAQLAYHGVQAGGSVLEALSLELDRHRDPAGCCNGHDASL
jgi:hypothetical protein